MGEQYVLMGPYKERSARTEVEEIEFPNGNPLNEAVNKLRDRGYKVKRFKLFINFFLLL